MFVARFGMEIPVLAMIFLFVVFMTISNNRAKDRRERLKVIEEALRQGNLEPRAQDELIQELTGRRVRRPEDRHSTRWSIGRWLFGLGWLGLFVGAAVLVAGGIYGDEDALTAGCIVAAVSFGVMSLPMALKELDRKGGRQNA